MKESKVEVQEASDSSLIEEISRFNRTSLREGTWDLTLGQLRPKFVGLLLRAVSFLDVNSDDYELQIGGARNFGAGIAGVRVVNPLYTESKVQRVFNRMQAMTQAMKYKDRVWVSERHSAFIRALQARSTIPDANVPMSEIGRSGDSV